VLVAYLADHLLDDVLHRDDAGGAAVFVHHQRQMAATTAHLLQQVAHQARCRHHQQRPYQVGGERRAALLVETEQVRGVDEPPHVVDGLATDGDAGEPEMLESADAGTAANGARRCVKTALSCGRKR
jgi:hypothetical protein